MATAYTPGLKVSRATRVLEERRLPLRGEVLVEVGQPVTADTVVARTYLPGRVEPVNVANKLGVEAREVPATMLKQQGEAVTKDEPIARSKGLFGLFKSEVLSPRTGKIDLVSETTGQVMVREPDVPVQVEAWVDGVVVEVIAGEGVVVETYGTYIQGIFGIGGEVTGELVVVASGPDRPLEATQITDSHAGKIVIGGSYVTHSVITEAVKKKVAGIIVGGIDDADLRAWLGYDLGVAITGSEELGLTLVVTEGFGQITMAAKTYELLTAAAGRKASMSGATQIRAGVIRPQIIVPQPMASWPSQRAESEAEKGLVMHVNSPVRVIRQPHFGALAKVVSLPVDPVAIETEARVRVVEVALESGERLLLPRANVELIEL